ncbi:hypothetical protein OG474_08660 [Kribbella sp. NBC_01505]|uniref:hypothetical protein n=1 Tax=Kribbella sp. NBC_01505 TaxID=2903580 RepID=UPI0038643433
MAAMLDGFLIETKEVQKNSSPYSSGRKTVYASSIADRQGAAQIVEHILDRVIPSGRTAPWMLRGTMTFSQRRQATIRAIAQLQRHDDLDENTGGLAPQLNADTMHPWVSGSRDLLNRSRSRTLSALGRRLRVSHAFGSQRDIPKLSMTASGTNAHSVYGAIRIRFPIRSRKNYPT